VAVVLPVYETFSYSVPAYLSDQARPGMRVLVPFGRRTVTGYLIGPDRQPDCREIKQILDVLDDSPLFPETMIPFFQWIASYYMHPPGLVVNTALPTGLNMADVAVLTVDEAGTRPLASSSATPPGKVDSCRSFKWTSH
jgi:primosomal protein N' (replication factor Y)